MGWETPVTNWSAASVPKPADFNRIENNIKELKSHDDYLKKLLGQTNANKALPIANGGTGATASESARKNLGIYEISMEMPYYVSTKGGIATTSDLYKNADKMNQTFKGIQIGNTIICSGCIDFKDSINENIWVKIDTRYKVISIVASVKNENSSRGANEEFVKRVETKIETDYADFLNQPNEKIIIKQGEYLEDALIRVGILKAKR